MKIGILAQLLSFNEGYRQAGVSRYIEYLLRYLPEEIDPSNELTVFTGSGARNLARVNQLPSTLRWKWTRWPTNRVPVRILWEQLAAPLVAYSQEMDLLHAPVNVAPFLSRTPIIVTIHDLAFFEYPGQYPGFQRRYLAAMTRASTHRAAKVITVSSFTGADVAERLDVPESKIVAVPNGVDEAFYPRAGTDELTRFREEQRLPDQFLLFVGTLQPRKNLIGLLRAYAMLSESERIPLFVVGGAGWMYANIFEEVQRLGISDEVWFPGYAASEMLPLWYSAATAFIYPSFYEGFGLPVLEAMACGTPVVTSDRTSLPEVAGDAGLLVDPDDPEDISEAIRTLLTDDTRREQLAQRGLERARQFTWRRTARETMAVYRDVYRER
jgi:glycosyltransferase involved in cell wall biosynthesis